MKKTLLFLLCAVFTAVGCKKEIPKRMDLLEIQLEGKVAATITKGAIESGHSSSLPINFLREDQSSDGSWGGYGSPLDATRESSGNITFSITQYYLTHPSYDNTKLVGWHPRSSVTDNKTTIPIDGKTDIMLSNEITGSKSSLFGATDALTHVFSHLLTQIRVTAYARSEAERELWGTVTSIAIKSTPANCTIDFPGSVSFGTDAGLELVRTSRSNDAVTAVTYPLSLSASSSTPTDCGYAIIAPEGSGGIILSITTQKGGTIDIGISHELIAGTAYNIQLLFTAKEITASATIENWLTSNISVTL